MSAPNPKLDPEGAKAFLQRPRALLTAQEQQLQYILRLHSHPMPCPLCEHPNDQFHSADDTKQVGELYDGKYQCVKCGIELRPIVPFVRLAEPGWHWRLADDARQVLLRLWTEHRAAG
ncbi:MAG: hypothetical protein KC503_34035 [Myxococcales bacterium]|nr:hypothetical protein [Myxococcales bacterium]